MLLNEPQICVCWSVLLKCHVWSVTEVLLSVQISWVWVELKFIVQGELGVTLRELTLWHQNYVPSVLCKRLGI